MASEGSYWLGRSSEEQQRLVRQHYDWTKSIGYLVHPTIAPALPADARIADLGTGTGIWLVELAKMSPSTYRLDGYDISDASFPPAGNLPANVTLDLGNFKMPFPEHLHGQYDLVNIRLVISIMGEGVWESTLRNALALLKPGGAIQWTEGNFVTARGFRGANPTSSNGRYLTLARLKLNGIFRELYKQNFPDFTAVFKDAGLQDIEEDVSSTDRLPEQRQTFTEMMIAAMFRSLKHLASTKTEGYWTEEEVDSYKEKAIVDMQSGAYLRWDLHVTIGFTSKWSSS